MLSVNLLYDGSEVFSPSAVERWNSVLMQTQGSEQQNNDLTSECIISFAVGVCCCDMAQYHLYFCRVRESTELLLTYEVQRMSPPDLQRPFALQTIQTISFVSFCLSMVLLNF
ncbi:hypothetical protein INR49_026800 [Caranx melampygus]|nr:hypothetical protein INR49_026800 [Caranx melampygus]